MNKLDQVRIGIIGCGRISDLNIQGYLDHPKCELITVYDINEGLAKKER